jgi:hypothetical protein
VKRREAKRVEDGIEAVARFAASPKRNADRVADRPHVGKVGTGGERRGTAPSRRASRRLAADDAHLASRR